MFFEDSFLHQRNWLHFDTSPDPCSKVSPMLSLLLFMLPMLRFSDHSHSWPKRVFGKKNLFRISQGSNTQPHNYQTNAQPTNQFMFHDNTYTSKIIKSHLMVQHIIKIIKPLNYPLMAYTRLKPKSSHNSQVLLTTWASIALVFFLHIN